ncbi:hypothetical protein GQX74_006946 [Glossina fuscipes]|nr:hypothetical protein GQX74_006946 [Glossina fuscipes]
MNLSILISINVAFAAAACPHHYRHHHYRYRLNGRLDLLVFILNLHFISNAPSLEFVVFCTDTSLSRRLFIELSSEAKVARHQPNDCPSKAMSSQYAKYATKILCDDEGVWPFIPV